MSADFLNGMFEFGGGFMILMHSMRLAKDKKIRGASVWPFVFFTSWGAWNLYFYPAVGCWWSFLGGVSVFGANLYYIGQVWYYRKN